MLTVWRNLWIEIDSMVQEPLTPSGRVDEDAFLLDESITKNTTVDDPALGFTKVSLVAHIPAGLEQFEGGRFENAGTGQTWQVVRSGDTLGSSWFVLLGDPGDVNTGTWYLDDDDSRVAQLPDDGAFLADPFLTAYRAAYIEPGSAGQWNPNSGTHFILHVGEWMARIYVATHSGPCACRDLSTTPSFWVRHVLMAYQPEQGLDGDPDVLENSAPGNNLPYGTDPPYDTHNLERLDDYEEPREYGLTPIASYTTSTSFVFKETVRDLRPEILSIPVDRP